MTLKKDKPFITRRKKKEEEPVKQETALKPKVEIKAEPKEETKAKPKVETKEQAKQETKKQVKKEVKKETKKEVKKETAKAKPKAKKEMPKTKVQAKPQEKPKKKDIETKAENKVGIISKEIKQKEKRKSNKQLDLLKELQRYKKTRVVLWGLVSGLESDEQSVKATVLYNNIPVIIRDNNYFDTNFRFSNEYANLSKKEKLNDKSFKLMTSVGSICPFIIVKVSEENGELVVHGSRVDALSKLRDIYFYHRYCKKSEQEEVVEGEIYKANVIYVCEQFATVELFGVETRLTCHTASEYPISNCKDALRVGDIIKVRVKKIHINEDSVYLKITRRLGLGKEVIHKIKEGDTRMCVVDSYSRSKDSYTCKWKVDNDHYINITVNRSSTNGRLELNVGDIVSVKVVKVNQEEGYAIGSAMKLG